MSKRVETAIIVLIYAFGAFLIWGLAYVWCEFNFWPKGVSECVLTWTIRLSFYCSLIFWIPTYHFGLKKWLKMGLIFFGCGFIWLSTWIGVAGAMELNWERVTILGYAVAAPMTVLYFLAYRGEWRRSRRILSKG